ncbi:helix-turn-helix transcriptional regulator, partial [Alistipes communis]
FLIKFEQKHSSYFRIMKERFPDLTTSDLRLSACLKMNLCTKEIASLMSLSVRAVENGRYRLRKKLGLTSAQNLNEFLLHIDSQESGPEDDEK